MQLIWDGLTGAIQLIAERDPRVVSAATTTLLVSCGAVALAASVGIPLGCLLARCQFPGRWLLVSTFRAAMGIPTVLIGLVCYAVLSRRGPLGGLDLLYTRYGIALGEFCLALPIVVSLTQVAIQGLDPRAAETAQTLGANALRRWRTYVSEARLGIALAIVTAFSRCVTELGIAMMVGGNLKYRTRTLTTATALETAQGEFSRGVAMSLILLFIAAVVALAIAWFGRDSREG